MVKIKLVSITTNQDEILSYGYHVLDHISYNMILQYKIRLDHWEL